MPVLWGTDAVHGHNNIPGATIFPHNIGLGAARDPELIRRIGEITALEVRVTGLDWAFSPTVAVARDARWGRTYESYSEDPEVVRQYAAAMVQGLQGKPGNAAVPRCGPRAGHARSTSWATAAPGARTRATTSRSEQELRDIDSAGYQAAIAAGAQTVMASYSSWHGQKMHGNQALLTEVLKGRMGFDGLRDRGLERARAAARVHRRQLRGGGQCRARHVHGPGWLEGPARQPRSRRSRAGQIPAARLDDAVRRVLRVKLRAHLLTEGRPSARPYAGHYELLGAAEHRAVARQAVRESLVLLKNRNHLLPLVAAPARAGHR